MSPFCVSALHRMIEHATATVRQSSLKPLEAGFQVWLGNTMSPFVSPHCAGQRYMHSELGLAASYYPSEATNSGARNSEFVPNRLCTSACRTAACFCAS